METTLTIENLKARKPYIIAKIAKLGLSEKTSSFMGIMKMEVEMGFSGSILDLVMQTYHSLRAVKIHKMAEICGNGIKANGKEINYSITKYL